MKHEIEIEGLPEGWEPVAYRVPQAGERFLSNDRPPVVMFDSSDSHIRPSLIVKKKQPRRIVLEETDEIRTNLKLNHYSYFYTDSDGLDRIRILREVKEPAPSLHNADDKESLRLSVDECKEIFHCKTANTMNKIRNFLKDK